MIIKRKIFTKWDETDALKGMRDSDILSQKKRSQNIGQNTANVAMNAAGGAVAGAAIGGGFGLLNKGKRLKSAGKLAKTGAIVGGAIGAFKSAKKINEKANENQFYNNRLKYAQTQAKRREKKDWKTNMTSRDGYSY